MAGSTRLIVGLGNPGPDYDKTRHNVGFEVIDRLASKIKADLDETGMITKAIERMRSAGLYLSATGRYRGRPLAIAKPLTFMNRSGQAVARLKNRLGITDQDILVVVDDIYLDLGTIRMRSKGGSGGHNGLESVAEALASDNFPRMRIGVGSTFTRGKQAQFVLAPFEDDEKPLAEEVIGTAAEAALTFVTDGIVTAMNRFNKRISIN